MSKVALISTFLLAIAQFTVAQTWGVDRDSDLLRQIDPTTGMTVSSVVMTPASGNGFTALSVDPTTGTFYVVDNTSSGPPRTLMTVDPVTGVTTTVGTVGAISGISFDANGVLYGIVGELGVAGTLVDIDKTSGATTVLASLGNPGFDGEEIAVSPFDGLIYRVDSEQFTSIDPNAGFAQTFITTLGAGGISEVTAIGFDASGDLLMVDLGDDLFSVTTTGVETLIGPVGHQGHGLDQPGLFGPPVPANYPGTGEDFVTSASLNGSNYATASTGNNDTIGLNVGDMIAVRHASPQGTFNFFELLAFATIAPIGTPSLQVFPGLHVLNGGTIFLTITGGFPGVPLPVVPGGNTFAGVHIGGALIGQSILVEGVTLTATAANGIFASANGLLLNFN